MNVTLAKNVSTRTLINLGPAFNWVYIQFFETKKHGVFRLPKNKARQDSMPRRNPIQIDNLAAARKSEAASSVPPNWSATKHIQQYLQYLCFMLH